MNDDQHDDVDPLDQGEMRERRSGRRRGGRRGSAPTLSTISWRDIPAQLTVRAGGDTRKVLLHARFQHAIDRAAAVAGLTSTDDYVQQWRTTTAPFGDGDVDALLDQQCSEIEHAFPRDRLESFVANGGLDPERRADSDETPIPDAPEAESDPS